MPTKIGSDFAFFCLSSRWMKIVNNHNPFSWQGNHSTSDVSSVNWLFPRARMLVLTRVGPSETQKEKYKPFFFCLLPHNLAFFLFSPSNTPKKHICLPGKLPSITYPQHGPIKLILARVAPNLASSEQWVECFESYQSKASSVFGRQKGSATSCLSARLINKQPGRGFTNWLAGLDASRAVNEWHINSDLNSKFVDASHPSHP